MEAQIENRIWKMKWNLPLSRWLLIMVLVALGLGFGIDNIEVCAGTGYMSIYIYIFISIYIYIYIHMFGVPIGNYILLFWEYEILQFVVP